MSFLLQPQQLVNLKFGAPHPPARPDWMYFSFFPAQDIPDYPRNYYPTDFPTGFTNTASFPCYFDVDLFIFFPWNDTWEKGVHKTFAQTAPNTYWYSWAPGNWQISATLA